MELVQPRQLAPHVGPRLAETVDRGTVLYETRRALNAAGPRESIAIRLADCDGERNSASMVINRQYAARGYGSQHKVPAGGNAMTFVASSRNKVFGTITLVVDSLDKLNADRTFPEEVERLRANKDAVLCELTKFAFDPSPDSRPFLASLFHIVYLYGTERFGGTDLLIEVNPRHILFYEQMLGFKKLGSLVENAAVSAPAQLMHISVAEIGQRIKELAGCKLPAGRSLYPYFFSVREETGLRDRVSRFAHGLADTSPPRVEAVAPIMQAA